jgi:hypothetical protein
VLLVYTGEDLAKAPEAIEGTFSSSSPSSSCLG